MWLKCIILEMVKVYIVSEQRKVAVQEARVYRDRGERTLGDAAGGKGTRTEERETGIM